MADVDIMVNDRLYKVACDDGQEERLKRLAGHFDRHVRALSSELGQIGESRLMLLSALTICDELFEARARLEDADRGAEKLDAETVGGARRVIDAASNRVEEMAEQLKAAGG